MEINQKYSWNDVANVRVKLWEVSKDLRNYVIDFSHLVILLDSEKESITSGNPILFKFETNQANGVMQMNPSTNFNLN